MSSNIRDNFITELGPEVGVEFYRLYVYWAEASVQFSEYKTLFDDQSNVDMLNAIGGSVFGNIQLIMQDSLILHITRLTDPPGSENTYRNLSLLMLPQHLKENENIPNANRFRDPEWLCGLNKLLKTAKDKAKYARRHRNERIAHLDYDTTMGLRTEPLRPVDIEEVTQIIDCIFRVIHYVYSAMYPNTDLFDTVSYQSAAGHFLAYERNRIDFLLYFDSLIQSELESDTSIDNFADMVFKKFNVSKNSLGNSNYWKLWEILADIEQEVQHFRDKGLKGQQPEVTCHFFPRQQD